MLRLKDIKIRENLNDEDVVKLALKKSKMNIDEVKTWQIFKKSVDARDKNDVHFVYTIDVELKDKNKTYGLSTAPEVIKPKFEKNKKFDKRPIIVGAGPAGLFAGLVLARLGEEPIIIERGSKVDERIADVEKFRTTGVLDTNSNVQFGEGGAGTFSDGKLNSGINSPYCKFVLEEFVSHGAPSQILYMNKPHVGTNNLVNVVKNIRKEIESLGGKFYFNKTVTDFDIKDNKLVGVVCGEEKFDTDKVILAIGHSARDTFKKLYELNVQIEPKSFSVGARIEHKQKLINESQYGTKTKLDLPTAEYKLVYHGENRSVYTFCMCPGGVVMASSSEEGTIVTNGMSNFERDGENANSAVLVSVTPEDFEGDSPLRGMYFQEELEKKAFIAGGKNYFAPCQRVCDFINNKVTTEFGNVTPTYLPGVTLCDLNKIFPEFISSVMKEGLIYFDKKIKGFANEDAILTGVETRSSSPVKIPRDENLNASVLGIYPCGEGAGYAGGIMSAAVDGIKVAMTMHEN